MSAIAQDTRTTLLEIRRRPGMYLVVVLTLAAGIGINTMFFTLFNGMVLRPLPFQDPSRLVAIHETQPSTDRAQSAVSAAILRDWSQGTAFAGIAAYTQLSYNLHADDQPERIPGATVQATLFPLLGVAPALGRHFLDEEDRPGARLVALISDAIWERQFNRDPRVIGRQITLDDRVYEVVGVMPEDFKFPHFAEVWTPLALEPTASDHGRRVLEVVARLAPGMTVHAGQAELEQVATRLASEYPETNRGWSARTRRLRDSWLPPVTQLSSIAQQVQVAFVLLIACANVAGLMLARAAARRYDTAVKAVLGASRHRLVQQFLTEGVILAAIAGVLGALLATFGDVWLRSLVQVPLPYWLRFEFDRNALFFAIGASLLSGVGLSLVPAIRYSRQDMSSVLKFGSRFDDSAGGTRLRRLLVVGQFALSAVLLVGALLMIKSFIGSQRAATGYQTASLLTLRLSLNGEGYADPTRRVTFVRDALDRLNELGPVQSAGIVNSLPTSGFDTVQLQTDGPLVDAQDERAATRYAISTGYLETLQVPVVAGRLFSPSEVAEGRSVAIIGSRLAQQLWPGSDAIGKRLRFAGGSTDAWLTVVGVVGDVAPGVQIPGMNPRPSTQVYVPYSTMPAALVTVVAGTRADPLAAAETVRNGVHSLDPSVPIYDVFPMEQVLARANWIPRLWSQLFSVFAGLALLMAAAGTFSMSAYAVSRRMHEFGVRIAMGAQPNRIFRSVLRDGLALSLVGTAIGLAMAFPMGRVLSRLLYGIRAVDLQVFGSVALILMAASLAASYLPARRAATIQPVVALRG